MILAIGYSGCRDHRSAPAVLVWDFSKDANISRVEWPASNHTDTWSLKGDYDLTIIEPGREFHEHVQRISFERQGDQIRYWIVIFDIGIPIERGVARAKEVLTKWSGAVDGTWGGSRYKTVDDYLDAIRSGENVDGQFHIRGKMGYELVITIFGHPNERLQRTCTLSLSPF